MKTRINSCLCLGALLLLSAVSLLLTGCATTEPENASARPWNSPQGWEYGGALPSMLTDPRR